MTQPEFYVDDAGEHRWRVQADNGRVVADSAEGYDGAEHCRDGWELVVDAALEHLLAGATLMASARSTRHALANLLELRAEARR